MDHFHPKTDTADGCAEVIDSTTVAKRVRVAIAERELSYRDAARAMGVSYRTALRRIHGERDFTANEIGLLSKRLGMSVDSLLFDHA